MLDRHKPLAGDSAPPCTAPLCARRLDDSHRQSTAVAGKAAVRSRVGTERIDATPDQSLSLHSKEAGDGAEVDVARRGYDEMAGIRFTARERDLVLEHTFGDDRIAEQLRSMAAGRSAELEVLAMPGDLDNFLGAIADAINHSEDPKVASALDRLYCRLEKLEGTLWAPGNSAVLEEPGGLCQPADASGTGDTSLVLQFRVELLGIDPPIWRRIQVRGDASLWDLHVAIQDAMGWLGYHLHVFSFLGTAEKIGIPLDDDPTAILPGWRFLVSRFLDWGSPLALYEYDFGDSWLHEVRFERVSPAAARRKYPRCLAGARHCPPEDCGGIGGYAEFLAAIGDVGHPEHDRLTEWVGDPFDPEAFDRKRVRFSDPQVRLRQMLGG